MSFVLSGFILFGQGFITLWAGANYSSAYIITLVFFISLFIPLVQNTGIAILQARNQMKFRSILYFVISIFSLILQIILSKRYAEIGCASAIGLALIIGQGIIMNIYYQKKQNINIQLFWKEIGKMLILPIMMTIFGLIISYYIDFSEIWNLVIGVIIFSVFFIYLSWILSLNDYERNLIKKPIISRFH